MNCTIKIVAITLMISLGVSSTAQARVITSISPPTGAGQGDIFCPQVQTPVDTAVPNNDNSISPSPNQINNFPGLSCTPKTFQEIAPIDTQLFVEPSGGTTEYLVSETVINDTESTWDGFNFEIGLTSDNPFGGDSFASPAVILLPVGTVLPNFDSDPQPTSSKFSQVDADGSFNINWTGGTVAPGESVDFTFSVDVPDDLEGNNSYNSFAIRQLPIASEVPQSKSVPEPSYLLGVLGMVGSGLAYKRKIHS